LAQLLELGAVAQAQFRAAENTAHGQELVRRESQMVKAQDKK
jgi:hypothetical protein